MSGSNPREQEHVLRAANRRSIAEVRQRSEVFDREAEAGRGISVLIERAPQLGELAPLVRRVGSEAHVREEHTGGGKMLLDERETLVEVFIREMKEHCERPRDVESFIEVDLGQWPPEDQRWILTVEVVLA